MKYVRLPRERLEKWLEAVESVKNLALRASERLGGATIILHGSYARGDFNLWSDIDVIIVSRGFQGLRILDRIDLIAEALQPRIEPIAMTPGELKMALKKPSWRQALSRGAYIVRDDYSLKGYIEAALSSRLPEIKELEQKIKRLRTLYGTQ